MKEKNRISITTFNNYNDASIAEYLEFKWTTKSSNSNSTHVVYLTTVSRLFFNFNREKLEYADEDTKLEVFRNDMGVFKESDSLSYSLLSRCHNAKQRCRESYMKIVRIFLLDANN